MASTMQKFLAELIGSFILVFFGTASVVLVLLVNGGLDIAAITMADWVAIGLAFGLALTVAIYALAPISGAHFNPAVTIGLWAGKKFPTSDVPVYLIAQFVGSIIASAALLFMAGTQIASTTGALGSVGDVGGIGMVGIFIAEFLGTALLMYCIMAAAVDGKAKDAALSIGLVLAGIIVAIGGFSGCGINPSRVFAPMLMNTLVGTAAPWNLFPVYLIAPILGAIVAVYLYDFLAVSEE
ncbi:MIP/aquaporin family protein [Methanosphaera sp. BMS]|uniref:MIP/aquaporin family protein n=1 Tax=Methanosphaera sp. BMS TaxID=1789762 RepID=UPI000DC1D6AA|nr:aquaporin [Methanosphaera sp. BMS]AWX31565.1 aquaporin [Methanosphaera sp. BMS]